VAGAAGRRNGAAARARGGSRFRSPLAHGGYRAEQGEVGRASMRLGRFIRDQRHPRALGHERPGFVGVFPEDRRAHHEHEVVALQRLAQSAAVGR
jgi:hypothetical protein